MKVPRTSQAVLAEFVGLDVKAEAVSRIIRRNQVVEYAIMSHLRSILKDKTPELEAGVVLLGMVGSRDFVCAYQQLKSVTGEFPALGPDGKYGFKPADVLKYAKKTEEYVSARHLPYGDTAYAAGMMFDRMVAIGDKSKAGKEYYEAIEDVWKHGMKAARVALEIAQTDKTIGFSTVAFAAGLVHDIGKLAMELLYPANSANSWKKFQDDLTKKPVSREVGYLAETMRFGLTHDVYGAQLAYSFGVFKNISKAILFHHEPFLAKGSKETFQLASLIALSSNIARNYVKPKNAADPIIKAQWLTPELREFRIDPKTLVTVMGKLEKETY